MEALQCIETRRSVRRFTEEPVTKEQIEAVVSYAKYAPTWKNTQVNRYIAVLDPDKQTAIAEQAVMGFEGNTKIIKSAPVLIVQTTVNSRSGYERDGSFSTSKGTHWESYDAGIGAQTLCLAAHEMGLGTVIMGVFDEEKVKEIVSVPEGQSVAALIAMGHPKFTPDPVPRKDVDVILSFQ